MNSDNIRYSWTPCTEILFEKKIAKVQYLWHAIKNNGKNTLTMFLAFFLIPVFLMYFNLSLF